MLDGLQPRERALLVHRWQELAPVRAQAWAADALARGPVGRELQRAEQGPAVEGQWDRVRAGDQRTALGQVFTPERLAARLAALLPDEPVRTLDPACGDGSLLVALADRWVAAGCDPATALAHLEGWDRDPHAAWLARARLVEWAVDHGVAVEPRIVVRDAFAPLDGPPFDAILANPPYLEAKRMRGAAPGLREALAGRYPALMGAWDLYVAFLYRAEELVAPGGHAAFLVPNKVLQARYGRALREGWVEPDAAGLKLVAVVDCATLNPRPFPGTSVYPVLLGLRAGHGDGYDCARVEDWAGLDRPLSARVTHATVRAIGGEHPVFVPFATWAALEPLLALPPLQAVAKVASTCSFHKKGLRERFVTVTPPRAHPWPYLGGISRARRTEVRCFEVRWEGYWLRYDADELSETWKNPLPRLETFARPKAILCQHARRVQAVADPEGRYVTKDVYPVAWPTDAAWSLDSLVALLNSTVFTALYNTLFQGVRVGGETYHYLPAFLHQVPVPDRAHPALAGLDDLAAAVVGDDGVDHRAWDAVDRALARAYGVSDDALDAMRQVHLARVGATGPGLDSAADGEGG